MALILFYLSEQLITDTFIHMDLVSHQLGFAILRLYFLNNAYYFFILYTSYFRLPLESELFYEGYGWQPTKHYSMLDTMLTLKLYK